MNKIKISKTDLGTYELTWINGEKFCIDKEELRKLAWDAHDLLIGIPPVIPPALVEDVYNEKHKCYFEKDEEYLKYIKYQYDMAQDLKDVCGHILFKDAIESAHIEPSL
jgi:hypothetical protein